MNTSKLFLTLLSFISLLSITHAQVGGISGGKINALNHLPIPVGTAEFEPNFGISTSKSTWDNNGNIQNIFSNSDSVAVNTSISFRMAYPLTDKLEIGTFIAENFSNWSFKYALNGSKKLGYGILGGVNIPFGNAIIDKSNRQSDHVLNYVLGGIMSYQINQSSSIDFNVQFQDYFHDVDGLANYDLITYLDYGNYIGDSGIQLLSSISYQHSPTEGIDSYLLTYYPGFSLEMKSNYFLVLSGTISLLGKNTVKSNGFAVAWTITI